MNFLCPSCKARYKIADEKLEGRAQARMKCKRCGSVIELRREADGQFIVVNSPAAGPVSNSLVPQPANPPAIAVRGATSLMPEATGRGADAGEGVAGISRAEDGSALASLIAGAAADAGQEWFLGIDDQAVGPLRLLAVRARIQSGQVGLDTLVWRDGIDDWQALSFFPELAAMVGDLPSTFERKAFQKAAMAAPVQPRSDSAPPPSSVRSSWVPPKPSAVPRALFLAVAALLVGTIGFVLGKEDPKAIIKYVEVPAKGEAQVAPTVAAAPAAAAAGVGGAAGAIESPAITGAAKAGVPSTPGSRAAGGSAAAAPGGLLTGLAGVPPPVAGPQATSSQASSGGQQLDSESVQRTVSRYSQGVKRACWQPALDSRTRDAPSSARVMVSITVAASGEVQAVQSEGEPRGYPGLARCIEGRVRTWRFPPSGGTTTVRVPFVFAAQ